MADERRVTEVNQEIEYILLPLHVTEVNQEFEYTSSQERVTEVNQEFEHIVPDIRVTSDIQQVEYQGLDLLVTSTVQQTEWDRFDLVVTSVMQMVEYLEVPSPPVPPEEDCPPFRIFWQDSNVRAHSWKDGGAQPYHVVRAFGGFHQVDGAKI